MTFRAINDSVIVEVVEVKRQSTHSSGLVLIQDDPAARGTTIGTVTSVGEGKFDPKTGVTIPPVIKVGDKVLLSLQTGVALDATHRMVRIDDIFAVVE